MIRRRLLQLLACGALAGCSSPPARYYRLIPLAGPVFHTDSKSIRVRDISVPGYLEGSGVAEPSGAYEFTASANDLWAGPLPGMLQSVLVQNLAQRLPQMTVTGSNGSIGTPADLTVEVNVLRFDPDASGRVTLIAQAAVKQADGRFLFTRTLQASAMPAGMDVSSMMAAMSRLWAGLADALAQEISQEA